MQNLRMKITYPDGTVHNGKKDFKVWTDLVNITDLDMQGKRVLDIATDEGWWAFWSEMQGAEYVEASDVELGEDYDWGAEKDWDWINSLNSNRGGRSVFDFHHSNLNSNVVCKKESIYDASGEFDIIFAHGLIYHLRHPLLAIDNMAKCCKGFFMFETFVDKNSDNETAQTMFYRTTELSNTVSNWTGATTACFTSWLKDSGFNDVYYTDIGGPLYNSRQIFIGVKDSEYNERFQSCSTLNYCDSDYWNRVFQKTKYTY